MTLRQQCHLLRKARMSYVLERTPHKMKNSSFEYVKGEAAWHVHEGKKERKETTVL